MRDAVATLSHCGARCLQQQMPAGYPQQLFSLPTASVAALLELLVRASWMCSTATAPPATVACGLRKYDDALKDAESCIKTIRQIGARDMARRAQRSTEWVTYGTRARNADQGTRGCQTGGISKGRRR